MIPKYNLRCFLSYSYKTDISKVKNILSDYNISFVDPIESFEYGSSILSSIQRQIRDSDFIVAVLDENINIPFEMGIAFATKKPIFVIVPDYQHQKLPNFIYDMTHTIANPSDYSKIKYNFQIFIDNLSLKEKRIRKSPTKTKFRGKRLSKNYLSTLDRMNDISGYEFEKYLGELFAVLDLEIMTQNHNKGKDFRADFSLWINELDSLKANPIIVEAKSSDNHNFLNRAIEQLSNQLLKYNARIGIIIYNNPSNKPIPELTSLTPLIVSISIQDLVLQLTEKSLPEIIIELRNKAIHSEVH